MGDPTPAAPGPAAPAPSLARSGALVVVALLAYFAIPFSGERWPFAVTLGIAALGVAIPFTIARTGRIRRSDQPVREALEAAVVLALLVLLSFAIAYYALATNTDQIPGIETKIDSLYFTVSTVATVGYGDIVPVGQAARAIVTFQIVANITLIAGSFRIVAGAARDRRAERVARSLGG